MEIIAALIIACSNLQGSSSYLANENKKSCIARVAKCGLDNFKDNHAALKTCSKDVY